MKPSAGAWEETVEFARLVRGVNREQAERNRLEWRARLELEAAAFDAFYDESEETEEVSG